MDFTSAKARLLENKTEYSENTPLAPYTTFKIGGAAALAVFPKTRDEAALCFDILRESGIRILVLGNGSNVLIDDGGFDGAAVILTGLREIRCSKSTVSADAGVSLTRLASEAAKHSLTGAEFCYGIPGTVGGGIFMNAGAYGGEMSQIVKRSEYYDLESGERGFITETEHDFSYRHSVYEDSCKIVLGAELELSRGDREQIESVMADLMSRRREKQPLELPSAGSTFKRGCGFITAQKIDEAGLKGRRVGGAEVSCKHAGFIVNRGGATASDVLALIDEVKKEIKEKFGLDIECEVRYIK